jgi:hypothetical protein
MEDYLRDDPQRVMRVNEIAAFLGVCSRTVHRLFTDGRLTKIKLGQRAIGARRVRCLPLEMSVT